MYPRMLQEVHEVRGLRKGVVSGRFGGFEGWNIAGRERRCTTERRLTIVRKTDRSRSVRRPDEMSGSLMVVLYYTYKWIQYWWYGSEVSSLWNLAKYGCFWESVWFRIRSIFCKWTCFIRQIGKYSWMDGMWVIVFRLSAFEDFIRSADFFRILWIRKFQIIVDSII